MPASHNKPPVLTLIAGPNGSGKTTLTTELLKIGNLGVLVNADQIADILAKRKDEASPSNDTQWEAAVSAEDMRWALLAQQISFSTETVMSDKTRWPRFIEEAKSQGYRVVLYFITTEDSSINVKRVAERVQGGGHFVEPDKIVSRYQKVMDDVLPLILPMVDEAILFDNSSPETGPIGILVITERKLTILAELGRLPTWAKSLLAKLPDNIL